MADVRVTFAFVTSSSIDCCAFTQCDDEPTANASEPLSGGLLNHSRVAIVKVLDYDTGCARVFRMAYPQGACMRSVYNALADAMAARLSEVICFAPPPLSAEGSLTLCAMNALEPADDIPDVLFCQKAAVPRRSTAPLSRWLVVNVLICGNNGALAVGHVPCLVQVAGDSINKDEICNSIRALLRMGLECERQLRSCAVFCCTVEKMSVVLRDPFMDGTDASQVAILYGAVDVGEVVLVSAPLLCSVVEARPSVLQAVVLRRYSEDGVTLYDVKEVDTALVVKRLTRVQLVPL
ncbi:hypothetical protein LSCM1_05993 [Leishmania martiniquensis]|uniref:Uncharacterized protein n=1 Tax=Leishmania martiniquensis TaxID=1580590 RepID=A0A836GNW2_9TRYP|nr:hypothetical protein LSCM1_05993 [Leishmania martiniquensis]